MVQAMAYNAGPPSRIVAAAVKLKDGLVVVGSRHFDPTMHAVLKRLGNPNLTGHTQGFVDQRGTFFGRAEALLIAHKAKQITDHQKLTAPCRELFSEDLY